MMIWRPTLCLLAAAVLLPGCRTMRGEMAKADKEAYEILSLKELEALGRQTPFSIETPYSRRDPQDITAEEIINSRLAATSVEVDLRRAIALALKNNREYQTRKESLFLSALSLSDSRHAYDFLFSHSTTVERSRPEKHEHQNSANSQLSITKLLKSGANLGLTLTNDLLMYTTGDPRRSATSAISVSLTQPLLRGAGRDIAAEGLKQAERNVIYEVRNFTRFQRTFIVDIASQYYRLAQLKDTIYNEYNNYQSLVRSRKRSEALAKDRLPEFQVDQTRQDELRSRNRYISAVDDYFDDLDDFKKQLGLTLDTKLSIDDSSLDKLTQQGLKPVPVTPQKAFATALRSRLDFLNEIDQFDDSKRQVKVAADALQAEVEFFADAALGSREDNDWARFNFRDWTGGAGLRIKLPLDRVNERNSLRREVINFERQLRSLGLAVDSLKTDVSTSLRNVEQARKSHQIQKLSVELAKRRVESANLLLQAGRASTRDLLEAQNALLSARNALTRNLVDYYLARLRLLQNMGRLDLEKGTIVERIKMTAAEDDPDGADELISPDELFGTKEKTE